MNGLDFSWHRGEGGEGLRLKRHGPRGRTYACVDFRSGKWLAILNMQGRLLCPTPYAAKAKRKLCKRWSGGWKNWPFGTPPRDRLIRRALCKLRTRATGHWGPARPI